MNLQKIREQFSKFSIDSLLITDQYNRLYSSGFTGSSGCVLLTNGSCYLLTDFRYIEQANNETINQVIVIDHGTNRERALKELIAKENLKHLGFESLQLTFNEHTKLADELSDIEFVPTVNLVEHIRSKKSKDEIDKIEKACLVADEAFEHLLKYIRPGISEIDLKKVLMKFFIEKDVTISFDPIVASGARGSMPHVSPSEKVIEKGDFVTLDFGCCYSHYASDMTRTVVVGKPDSEQLKVYSIVLEAQMRTIEAVESLRSCQKIDSIAREIIANEGYGKNFGHGLGHGVGLYVHEKPSLSVASVDVLEEGMVFSIEPGIYLPEKFGVRIEDLVALTKDGPKILTKSNKELIQL